MSLNYQDIWDEFLICIDDTSDTKYTSDNDKIRLGNLATRAVLNRLDKEGISVADSYSDVSFTKGTQETAITTRSRVRFAKRYTTSSGSSDEDLVDDEIYPIIEEELAKRSENPCFYMREDITSSVILVYLGYYRVPTEDMKFRYYYVTQKYSDTVWSTMSLPWISGFIERFLRDCIVCRMAYLSCISDIEQRSVWEIEYEKAIDNMIEAYDKKTIQKQVIDVLGD